MSNINPTDYGLGRNPSKDEEDRKYLIQPLLAKIDVPVRTSRYWNANGWWGNQYATPHCVGYSWTHWIEDGPVTHKGQAPIINPESVYREAQLVDEWAGEQYDGTSVRAGAKVLQSKGLIQSYLWAWDVNTLADAVLNLGPVVVGTYWYENMFFPNSKGILRVGGYIAGGHAYLINGVNTKRELFRIKNSWGREWGKNGYAYISFADMARLIAEDGEVCLAIENKI